MPTLGWLNRWCRFCTWMLWDLTCSSLFPLESCFQVASSSLETSRHLTLLCRTAEIAVCLFVGSIKLREFWTEYLNHHNLSCQNQQTSSCYVCYLVLITFFTRFSQAVISKLALSIAFEIPLSFLSLLELTCFSAHADLAASCQQALSIFQPLASFWELSTHTTVLSSCSLASCEAIYSSDPILALFTTRPKLHCCHVLFTSLLSSFPFLSVSAPAFC